MASLTAALLIPGRVLIASSSPRLEFARADRTASWSRPDRSVARTRPRGARRLPAPWSTLARRSHPSWRLRLGASVQPVWYERRCSGALSISSPVRRTPASCFSNISFTRTGLLILKLRSRTGDLLPISCSFLPSGRAAGGAPRRAPALRRCCGDHEAAYAADHGTAESKGHSRNRDCWPQPATRNAEPVAIRFGFSSGPRCGSDCATGRSASPGCGASRPRETPVRPDA